MTNDECRAEALPHECLARLKPRPTAAPRKLLGAAEPAPYCSNHLREHHLVLPTVRRRLVRLFDQDLLVRGVPRQSALRRARAAGTAHVAKRPACIGQLLDERPYEAPRAHVLRFFLDPD